MLPPILTNQKLNEYLKEIGALAGINEKIVLTKTKGGLRLNGSFNKYEVISTHTARRSFATNMYNMGIPSLTIMAITGHKTEKAFLRYIKVTAEQHASKNAGNVERQRKHVFKSSLIKLRFQKILLRYKTFK